MEVAAGIVADTMKKVDATSTPRNVFLLVNHRFVRDRSLLHAAQAGYGELLERGRYPLLVLHLNLDAATVDVNVHPQKLEVRMAGADAVFTICEGLRGDLVARGFARSRIHLMMNGVDLSLFGAPPPRDAALAERLGLGTGPVVGFIGSFYDYEGLDDLIEAMPRLVARLPEARLLLVGGGPCAKALEAQAKASPAANAIRFVGRVPHEEVEHYYALCDVMAYPRKKSRLTDLVTPLKPLEAMAEGKLVAASDVGGHRELISDGETGTLFAPDDPAACADALAGLLGQSALWEARRAAARAHVARSHDWAENAKNYRAVYHHLLGKPAEQGFSRAA